MAVFIGTFFIYRLSVWVPIINANNPSIQFYESPRWLEFGFYLALLIGLTPFINFHKTILLLFWGVLSIFYFTNVQFKNYHFKGLRSIIGIKTLHITLSWTVIGFLFNDISANAALVNWQSIGIRFIIIFLICLGVDVRDIDKDNQASTHTLATYFGLHRMKIGMALLNFALLLYLLSNPTSSAIEIVISCLLLVIILSFKINRSSQSFTILLDGLLFLYALAIAIATSIRFN